MKKILKQTLKHLFSFPVNAIASACLVMWIFGLAHHSCLAADEPERTEEEKHLVAMRLSVPPIAQGYEAIYQRFLNGALIYRPNGDGNDEGMITLSIRDLSNPLEGTFDLSRCDDVGTYLSISTGYPKKKPEENKDKVRIWFAPRFLVKRELKTTAQHFQKIYGNWKKRAAVGIFWSRWEDELSEWYYLTTENMDELSKNNLYQKWRVAGRVGSPIAGAMRLDVQESCTFVI